MFAILVIFKICLLPYCHYKLRILNLANLMMMATVSSSSVASCCRCCNTGVCVRCSYVKAGSPGRLDRCRNIASSSTTTCSSLSAPPQSSLSSDTSCDPQPSANHRFPSTASPSAVADPSLSSSLPSLTTSGGHLPSLHSLASASSLTLLHIPKDTWA